MHPGPAGGVLAGRAAELTLLERLLADLIRGTGSAVLIEGEPGIGKTGLVRAAVGGGAGRAAQPAARSGFQVFWGTGDELGQDLPLLPFLDALQVRRSSRNPRRTAIAGLLRGEIAADRSKDVPALLAEQLIALVLDETETLPAVLVIDDMQWADPVSVQLWGQLARITGQVPLLLVGMTRPVPHREDLVALRRTVDGGSRISLSALPQAAVAELAGALAGGRPDSALLELAEGAGGNPLYLTELIGALGRAGGIAVTPAGDARLTASAVPSTLPAIIADRLGFVSAPARQVLRTAALLGVEFAFRDLATVLGASSAELTAVLEVARTAGILGAEGENLAFRHPLIWQALYEEVPPALRAARHRDAGQALAAGGAPPDRVARQLLRAVTGGMTADAAAGEDPELRGAGDSWLVSWLAGAADSLVARVPEMAAELLTRAVSGLPAGSEQHDWLLSRLAGALYRTGAWTEARQAAERGLSSGTKPDLLVDLHWILAQCLLQDGSAGESVHALDQALAVPGISAWHRGRLLALHARMTLANGEIMAALDLAGQALAVAGGTGDTWAAGWARHVLATGASMQGRASEALSEFDQAFAVVEADPMLDDLGLLLQVNRAGALGVLGRADEAQLSLRRALRRAEQVGSVVRAAQARGMLGQLLFETGQWEEALTQLAAVPACLKEPGADVGELSIGAVVAFYQDDPAGAREILARVEVLLPRTRRLMSFPMLAQAMEREDAGALDEALAVLTVPFTEQWENTGEFDCLLADAVRLAHLLGDASTVESLAALAGTLADEQPSLARQALALHCQGIAAQDSALLLAAARQYGAGRWLLPQAQALEAAARILAEADDRIAARQAFEQASRAYEYLGALAPLSRLQAAFRGYGIRRGPHSRHRRAASGWDSLTDTELKVAAFVEEGLSNPEIAGRMMLSRRTVATHVSHILGKLGVTSRTDIARESARRAMAGG